MPASPPPSFIDCYRGGWSALLRSPLPLLIVSLAWVLVQTPSVLDALPRGQRVFGGALPRLPAPQFLAWLIDIFVGGPLLVGLWHVALRSVRGQRVALEDGLVGFRCYLRSVLCVLLFHVLVGLGLLLCIVPGLLLFGRLAAAPFRVGEQRDGALESLHASWRLTRGRWLTALWIGLSWIPLGALGLLLCGVGAIPAAALGFCALAVWYNALSPLPLTEPSPAPGSAPPTQSPTRTP